MIIWQRKRKDFFFLFFKSETVTRENNFVMPSTSNVSPRCLQGNTLYKNLRILYYREDGDENLFHNAWILLRVRINSQDVYWGRIQDISGAKRGLARVFFGNCLNLFLFFRVYQEHPTQFFLTFWFAKTCLYIIFMSFHFISGGNIPVDPTTSNICYHGSNGVQECGSAYALQSSLLTVLVLLLLLLVLQS